MKPTFLLWYAELKEPRVDILFVKNMTFPGIVLLKSSICVFDLINSYLLSCEALWPLTAFEVNVLSLAMITIETPGLKPKRLFILGKNFHVKTTQTSLQSQFCNKRNF